MANPNGKLEIKSKTRNAGYVTIQADNIARIVFDTPKGESPMRVSFDVPAAEEGDYRLDGGFVLVSITPGRTK